MRIIAGTHRGKKLVEYYTTQTRPTTDRVKENVFNLLTNYLDLSTVRVLDLFAGTGAYGIECLSRGAQFVHFNDLDAAAVAVIKKNIGNLWSNCCVTQNDYTALLPKHFDLVFLDPPYRSDFARHAVDQLNDCFIVLETDQDFTDEHLVAHRRYGRAQIYLIDKRQTKR